MAKRVDKYTWQVAMEVLRETGATSVGWCDPNLLHAIALRAKLRCAQRGSITVNRVLNTLSRRPGELVPGLTKLQNGRLVRVFWLPEHAPRA